MRLVAAVSIDIHEAIVFKKLSSNSITSQTPRLIPGCDEMQHVLYAVS